MAHAEWDKILCPVVSPGRATSMEVGLVEGPAARSAEKDCLAPGWHLAGQESGEQLFPLS